MSGKADAAMDVVDLKISKHGGLTRIKQARDLCVSMGDSWGGDITTAAIALLAPANCSGCGWVERRISFLAGGKRLGHGRA